MHAWGLMMQKIREEFLEGMTGLENNLVLPFLFHLVAINIWLYKFLANKTEVQPPFLATLRAFVFITAAPSLSFGHGTQTAASSVAPATIWHQALLNCPAPIDSCSLHSMGWVLSFFPLILQKWKEAQIHNLLEILH